MSKVSPLRRRERAPERTRRSLLRRMGIGARLWLFLAIPGVALIALVGSLVLSDIRTVDDLQDFTSTTTRVETLVEARAVIQDERHDLIDPATRSDLEQRPLADQLIGARTVDFLNITQSTVDIGDELITARGLAGSAQTDDAILRYNQIISVIDTAITTLLNDSPDGEIDRRSDALVALLAAEEALLLEDLELQLGDRNRLEVARLHATETEGLARFARDSSAAGLRMLEQITISDAWRQSTIARTAFLDAPFAAFDQDRWNTAAEERRAAIDGLLEFETAGLIVATEALADRGINRLIVIAGSVAATLIIGALIAFSIRRSIVGPLGKLANAASQLSKGELEPVDDPASDEIAKVGSAFSSLRDTMESIWTDLDEVERSVRRREFDKRIGTEALEGDWLRLGNTLNATLDAGERHSKSVNAELLRRNVLAEITNAALVAENGPALTSLVLRHLPAAVPGSHAHLHQHPAGPPEFDLGIHLEPSISALELPSLRDEAQVVELRDTTGVASLVNFGSGAPAVLVLAFGESVPDDPGPLIGLVETAAQVLAQGHRRQVAEWAATHNFEHDALTGLYNSDGLSRWYADHANDATERVVIGVQPLRLDVLDSSEGRNARNTLLTIVSRRLRHILDENDLMARIGDPEFVLVTERGRADDLAQKIVAAFAHPLSVGRELVSVDVGVGIAALDGDLADAVANAATAVRQGDGRNTTIVHFDEKLREVAVRQNEIERWLESAIDNGDLEVHFQPVVNAITTVVEGYECLVRGTRNGVPVSPGEFIPLAEASTRILDIGDFTLREACAALPFLPGDSPYVAVNLSPLELSDPELITRIDTILKNAEVDRGRIVMEVTEGATTTDDDIELLHRIRGLGVKIAIDDFGSGHSNLGYLSNMPAQIVKLDRSLVTPMAHDRNARTIVAGAIEMAHNIGMSVVGEGVETDIELNALRRVRCDRIQGWLTGRPAPLRDLIEVTRQQPASLAKVGVEDGAEQTAVGHRTTILPPETA